MACLKRHRNKKGESFQIVWTIRDATGNRREKSVFLGSGFTERQAAEIRYHVEEILRFIETRTIPDPRLCAWLDALPSELKQKFARAGLLAFCSVKTVGDLLRIYEEEREKRLKPNTLKIFFQAKRAFVTFFPENAALTSVDRAAVERWKYWLKTTPTSRTDGYSEQSVTIFMNRMSSVFNWGAERGYLAKNPFKGVKRGRQENRDHWFFIEQSLYEKILGICPDPYWRARIALLRIGGLRISETCLVRWHDIDWKAGRMLVRSPKTEHHEGKDRRIIPLFPELAKELSNLKECHKDIPREGKEDGLGVDAIFPRAQPSALYKRFHHFLTQAGIAAWPDLFHNLRRSRATELFSRYPPHVAGTWLGQGVQTAMKHYLQVLETDYIRAATEVTGAWFSCNREKSLISDITGIVTGKKTKQEGSPPRSQRKYTMGDNRNRNQ